MNYQQLIKDSYGNAKKKGFHKEEFNLGEKLMLIISELGEALEAHRNDKRSDINTFYYFCPTSEEVSIKRFKSTFKDYIKDTLEDELADVCIRAFDLAGKLRSNLNISALDSSKILLKTHKSNNVGELLFYIVGYIPFEPIF